MARKVWIHAESTAKLGGLTVVGLHEIPLLKKKLVHDGEVRLIGEWPEGTSRYRDMSASDVMEEYNRMRDAYLYEDPNATPGSNAVVDLVADFYGPPSQSRLVSVMRRIEKAFREMVERLGDETPTPADLEELVALAEPEADFGDGVPYEDPALTV